MSRKCLSTAKESNKYRVTRNQIQEQKLDRSTKCREAIKEGGAFLIDPPGIEELSGLRYEKGLRSLTDSIEEVSSHILKLVFREEKNTDMNAIQHATQPMIQSTQ